jgi:hypothetical protein
MSAVGGRWAEPEERGVGGRRGRRTTRAAELEVEEGNSRAFVLTPDRLGRPYLFCVYLSINCRM